MSSQEGLLRATGRLLVLLALVAIPAAIYAFVVVKSQVASATAQNLRAVGEIGAQLDDRLDALRQVGVTFLRTQREGSNKGDDPAGADVLRQLKTNDWLRNAKEGRGIAAASVGCPKGDPTKSPRDITASDVTVTIAAGRAPLVSVVACAMKTGDVVALQVPLEDLIARRSFDSAFDGILIAGCDGLVLYADTRREIAVSDIAELAVDAAPAQKSDAQKNASKTGSPCVGRSQSWVLEPREVAGIPLRAFGIPYWPSNLTSEHAESDSGSPTGAQVRELATLYLIGLESEAGFRQRTRTLPFEVIVAISPLIVLALLAWPFLVIVLSAPTSRFGGSVPVAFAASMLGGAGLLAVIAVALTRHYETSALRDHLLARVANELAERFHDELAQSVNLLGPDPVAARNPLLRPHESVPQAIEQCAKKAMPEAGAGAGPRVRCFARFGPEEAPLLLDAADVFETAFQLDANGERVGPDLSLRDAAASRRPLDDRGYFLRASKGFTSELDGQEFVIEQIRSKDFGWTMSSIAAPAAKAGVSPAPSGQKGAVVLVANKRMQTFFHPVLPLGVGFAVVRDADGTATLDGPAWRTGDVLFHPEESRTLIENILSETDGNRGLELALAARRSADLSVSYHGSPYRFHTLPLEALPWTLIVTYDKSILRTFTWRTLFGGGTAFVSYLVLISFAAWALERCLFRRHLPAWFWPSRDNRARHRALTLPLLAVAALLLAAGFRWIAPGSPAGALWSILLGTFVATHGALCSHFGTGAAWPELAGTSLLRWIVERARRNLTGTVLLGVGIAAIVLPPLVTLTFEPRALLLALALLGLFAVPTAAPRGRIDADRTFVGFLLAILAAVSLVPGILLASDTFGFHRQAYEKAHLAHVARAAARRDEFLLGEARRLQATTFDRAGIPPLDLADTRRSRSFVATDTEFVRGALDELTRVKEIAAEQTRYQTATSWFATMLPVDTRQAMLFADGWRLQTDGDATYWWTDERDRSMHVSVPRSGARRYELRAVDGGLFDPASAGAVFLRPWLVMTGPLLLGLLVVAFLARRALRTVAVSFFGPRDLRDAGPARARPEPVRWQESNPEDVLLLRYLADARLVSCVSNDPGIRRLIDKGLVEFAPALKIASDAVAEEIRITPRSAAEREFESSRAGGGGAWAGIRGPFYTLLGFGVVALIVAAPNALSSTMTVLAASAGGVGVIVQVMNLMLRGK
ncbi:MAG TPA: hypothetical protein VE907_11365 [Gammaproteobacteria bacterium]|nr:hypothetical protein [Gammaproteobacteria bacterium]